KYISIGSLEPQFYKELLEKLDLVGKAPAPMDHLNPAKWNELRPTLTEIFLSKTRDEWDEVFDGSDVCYAPVLAAAEVFEHEHHKARGSFVDIGGIKHAVAAPRFSRTKAADPKPAAERGADNEEVFAACGITYPDPGE
ncbi:MAG: CoA transferase, partial [Polyangiales bacterium]